ncbi:MAG: hypothetical protein MUQ25_16995 [Candidatus Aminicenantes bacterium]|nr:hypothetical protein [Candidatus Aminicenantes bacterium]
MKTIDLKKTLKPYYTASAAKPSIIDVPPMNGLMVEGLGDPQRSAPEKLRTIIRHPVEKAKR